MVEARYTRTYDNDYELEVNSGELTNEALLIIHEALSKAIKIGIYCFELTNKQFLYMKKRLTTSLDKFKRKIFETIIIIVDKPDIDKFINFVSAQIDETEFKEYVKYLNLLMNNKEQSLAQYLIKLLPEKTKHIELSLALVYCGFKEFMEV